LVNIFHFCLILENGVIEAEEFDEQAPQFIRACSDLDTDNDLDTVD
jgi:hypothetical protein